MMRTFPMPQRMRPRSAFHLGMKIMSAFARDAARRQLLSAAGARLGPKFSRGRGLHIGTVRFRLVAKYPISPVDRALRMHASSRIARFSADRAGWRRRGDRLRL